MIRASEPTCADSATSFASAPNGAADGQKGCDVERLICAIEGVLDDFGADAKSKLHALARLAAKISQEENGPLTALQESILAALDGKALGVEALADECTHGDTKQLYRAGLTKILATAGRVMHKRGVGYFRPDRPPPDAAPEDKAKHPNGRTREDEAVDAYAPPPRALIERDVDIVICRRGQYFRGFVEALSFKSDETVCPPNGTPVVNYGYAFACIKITRPDQLSRQFAEKSP
ncbi:MAG TPA: hypothetical protein VGP76_13275 [Planctomycetaceae bacterium]|nr:hypothetical protein [Planctomycetaceae bacterium]